MPLQITITAETAEQYDEMLAILTRGSVLGVKYSPPKFSGPLIVPAEEEATATLDTDEKTTDSEDDPAPDVDADGVEWDETLHAATKTKTADGKWRARRNSGATPPPPPPPAKKTDPESPSSDPELEPTAPPAIDEFREVMAYAAKMMKEKRLTPKDLNDAAQDLGIEGGIGGLARVKEMSGMMFDALKAKAGDA